MGQINNNLVLIIGDSGAPTENLSTQLKAAGFACTIANSQIEGSDRLAEGSSDLVMLVLPMANEDGLAICAQLRSNSSVPIIAIAENGQEQDCIDALGAGSDDYISGPLSGRLLEARSMAAIRRATQAPYRFDPVNGSGQMHGVLQVGGIRLDLTTCRVSVDGAVKTLTPNEFRLMAIFLSSPGAVFVREDLRRRVWPNDQHSLHLVEVHIANLRAKIERDPHHPVHIVTVRSRGYRLAIPS